MHPEMYPRTNGELAQQAQSQPKHHWPVLVALLFLLSIAAFGRLLVGPVQPVVGNQPELDLEEYVAKVKRADLIVRAENAQREIENVRLRLVAEALFVHKAAQGKVPMGQQPADYWRNQAREAYEQAEAFMAEVKSRQNEENK